MATRPTGAEVTPTGGHSHADQRARLEPLIRADVLDGGCTLGVAARNHGVDYDTAWRWLAADPLIRAHLRARKGAAAPAEALAAHPAPQAPPPTPPPPPARDGRRPEPAADPATESLSAALVRLRGRSRRDAGWKAELLRRRIADLFPGVLGRRLAACVVPAANAPGRAREPWAEWLDDDGKTMFALRILDDESPHGPVVAVCVFAKAEGIGGNDGHESGGECPTGKHPELRWTVGLHSQDPRDTAQVLAETVAELRAIAAAGGL